MFKALRDRLKNWGKALEDEVDKELDAKVEAELQKEVTRAEAKKAPAAPPPPPPSQAPAVPHAAPPEKKHDTAPPRGPSPPAKPDVHVPAPAPVTPPPPSEPKPTSHGAREERRKPAAPQPPSGGEAKRERRVPAPGGRRLAPSARLDEKNVMAELEAELARAVDTQKKVGEVVERRASTGLVKLSDEKLDELLWDLELSLLEADVALPVIEEMKGLVKAQLQEASLGRGGAHELVMDVLRTAIASVLKAAPFDFDEFVKKHAKPVVIMFVGVNGTGKTTSIGRIAHRLKNQGFSVVMAAGDTFRAGAIEQLTLHAERLGVKIIKHGPGSDPAAVAFDAIEHARSRRKDVVLLDTAGRQQTNVNLMEEMAKIKRVAQPHLILFVGDALAGNDAVEQARAFHDTVGVDGVILTKVDADAKGGAALSVAHTIGKPLVFIGVGQEYDDLIPFDPDWMVDRLFGTSEAA